MSEEQAPESRPTRVVVWHRSSAMPPEDPRRDVLRRLRDLEAAGQLDEVTVRTWGKSVPCDEIDEDRAGLERSDVANRIADFRSWATRTDRSLEPAFCRASRTTMTSDRETEVLRLPMQCLAVYGGDRLVDLYPNTTSEGPRTVRDGLGALAETVQSDGVRADGSNGPAPSSRPG
ncbi:MAG: HTH domain-containing protein [Haloarculaceae archaeon]